MTTPSKQAASNPPPMASTKGELRRLNVNTKATAAELKTFLAELKGRSPQEMLGIVAASQLVRSLVLSTVLVGAALVAFTAIPFFLGGKEESTPARAEVQPAASRAAAPASPPDPEPAAKTPDPPAVAPDLSNLGVNEKKMAPPAENPLENKKDDFLEGLE